MEITASRAGPVEKPADGAKESQMDFFVKNSYWRPLIALTPGKFFFLQPTKLPGPGGEVFRAILLAVASDTKFEIRITVFGFPADSAAVKRFVNGH